MECCTKQAFCYLFYFVKDKSVDYGLSRDRACFKKPGFSFW